MKPYSPQLARLRGALMALACACWCSSGNAAAEAEVQIDMALAADGALELAYNLPAGVKELRFLDGGAGHEVFRNQHLQAADACAQRDATRMWLRDAPDCGRVLRWRVQPLLLSADREYEPAQALADGSLLADTGYYAAVAAGHGLHWVLHAPTDGYAIALGKVEHGTAQWRADAAQVQAAQAQPGTTSPLAVAAHHYVLLGRAPTETLGRVTLVLDPALDAARAQQIRQTLGEAMARLTLAYGVAPSTAPMVVASVADLPGFHGDTTAGNTMRLQLPRQADTVSAPQLDRFVVHEAVHWWNAGIYGTDHSRPWLHEGHAEWASLLLLREAGKLSDAQVAAELQSTLNRCAMVRGETPAVRLTPSSRDDFYACGMSLMALAQALHAQRNTDPDAHGLAMLASLHQGASALDVQRFMAWADGTAQGGTLRRLLTDESLGFASGLAQALAALGLADARPLGDLPAPLPSEVSMPLANTLLGSLMARDCGGNMSFWTLPDRLRIDQRVRCEHLRTGQDVVSVQGLAVFQEPLAAWQRAQQRCEAGQPVSLGYAEGEPSLQPCPNPWPALPVSRWIVLRPDALHRLGL